MSDKTPGAWSPQRTYWLRGAILSVLIGGLIELLVSTGAGRFDPAGYLWSGLLGLFIFLTATGSILLADPKIRPLGLFARALIITMLLAIAGFVSWMAVQTLATLILRGELFRFSTGSFLSLGITIVIAILVGSALYNFESVRGRLVESSSRLKEAEIAEEELRLAREIQQRLLPETELSGPGYRISARNVAARYVAGDFYDVFPLQDGALGIVVADVAGKGIGTSLIMASVKAMLPLLAEELSPAETLRSLNRRLVPRLDPRQFVALCYVRFDPGSGALDIANAGLPDPYVLRPGKAPLALTASGPRLPLGLRHDQEYLSSRWELKPEERLLLISDGLPEARTAGGEPLGYDSFEDLLSNLATAAPWLDDLLERVHSITNAEIEDDWTAVLVERTTSSG